MLNYLSNFIKVLILILCIFFSNKVLASNNNNDLEIVYKLLQEKNFKDGLQELKLLSQSNNIKAQLLFAKVLFSGDLTPQNFEQSYFWASSALLGGLNKSNVILEKLSKYLDQNQVKEIKENLRIFFEKKVYEKDKRALIQIAKLYETYLETPDFVNAYTWYNIAVAQGIKSAKNKRDEIINELDEKELLEAQKLSIKLFNKINK